MWGPKLTFFSVSIEVDLVFVWVVEVDSISVWAIELDLISVYGSGLICCFCGGRNWLDFSIRIKTNMVFVRCSTANGYGVLTDRCVRYEALSSGRTLSRRWLSSSVVYPLWTSKKGLGFKLQSSLTDELSVLSCYGRTEEVRGSNPTQVVFPLFSNASDSPHNSQALSKRIEESVDILALLYSHIAIGMYCAVHIVTNDVGHAAPLPRGAHHRAILRQGYHVFARCLFWPVKPLKWATTTAY